jgi:probable phosphoglycerate mutase
VISPFRDFVMLSVMADSALNLILVRHGLTDWNEQGRLLGRTQIELNTSGQAQAAAVAKALGDERIDEVFSSPLRRAQETAAPIAQALGFAVQTAAELDEVGANRWVGQSWQELREQEEIRRYVADPLYVSDAFEPATAVRDRVAALADHLRQTHAGKTVVLVSHGDPLRVLVSHCIAMPLGKYRSLAISNGSITRLRLFDGGAQLHLLNWQPPRP